MTRPKQSPAHPFTLCRYEKAYDCFRKALDRGFAAPALRLAQLYRQGDFVEQDLEKSLYYASLAAYQSDESLKGRECQELFLQYCKKCPRFCETSSQDYDLATYWSGKAAEIDPKHIPGFVSLIATYNSENWGQTHIQYRFPWVLDSAPDEKARATDRRDRLTSFYHCECRKMCEPQLR